MTDRAIQEAVRGGARGLAEVTARCGAGGRCGGCRPLVELVVRLELEASGRAEAAPAAALAARVAAAS
ncbi:MAG: (2Fe-2S)-binding protein [Polyangiaceae bacterium]|nr:(2Fe-2S)-binding protein [Polyangiaceae bacterium]